MKVLQLFFFFLSILFIQGCVSKKLTGKAIELENQGLYKEAADYYFRALEKKRDNIEAKVGLKRNGQKVLEDDLKNFYNAYNIKDHKHAVYHYLDAQNYHHKVESVGVSLAFPNQYNAYYAESKNIYLEQLYVKGDAALKNKNYEQAQKAFREIMSIDDTYKNTNTLLETAILEPMYMDAKKFMSNHSYKQAYYTLVDISNRSPNYKDVQILQKKALEEAQLSIAILPFLSSYGQTGEAQTILGQVTNGLMESNNPFIKLVDRTFIERILQEQKFNVSGLVDSKNAIDVGKLIGAKTIIFARINQLYIDEQRPVIIDKKAYIKTQEKVFDESSKMNKMISKYTETNYQEVSINHKVKINFDFQLISAETGEILTTKMVEFGVEDHVYFAQYLEGDYRSLSPNPNSANIAAEYATMQKMFGERNKIMSIEEMISDICAHTSSQVINKILTYEQARP